MTPSSITQWLQQPHNEIAKPELQALLDQYPYFTPLHYMAIASQQQDEGGMQLNYSGLQGGNWLLFHQIIQRANAKVASISEEIELIVEQSAVHQPQETKPEIVASAIEPIPTTEEQIKEEEASIIQPVFTEDYFLHQGIPVAESIPEELDAAQKEEVEEAQPEEASDPQSLMVVMSFTDWLMHYKSKTQKEKEEEEDRKAVKHMWQREKLAAALEEEDDEIPENVFEMAVNSISKEDGLVSESLAEILAKQGKWEKAIEMYRKLSLRNPQKSTYFAQQIAAIQKKSE